MLAGSPAANIASTGVPVLAFSLARARGSILHSSPVIVSYKCEHSYKPSKRHQKDLSASYLVLVTTNMLTVTKKNLHQCNSLDVEPCNTVPPTGD